MGMCRCPLTPASNGQASQPHPAVANNQQSRQTEATQARQMLLRCPRNSHILGYPFIHCHIRIRKRLPNIPSGRQALRLIPTPPWAGSKYKQPLRNISFRSQHQQEQQLFSSACSGSCCVLPPLSSQSWSCQQTASA